MVRFAFALQERRLALKNLLDIDNCFWIDPDGKIQKWDKTWRNLGDYSSVHYAIARRMLPKVKFPKSPDDVLLTLGWIIIGSASGGNLIRKYPTQAQINTLYDLGKKRLSILDDRVIDITKPNAL
jgi:hypothetical protein